MCANTNTYAYLMYCVEKKTLKASPLRKSRDESRPLTGRRRKPVRAPRNALMSSAYMYAYMHVY